MRTVLAFLVLLAACAGEPPAPVFTPVAVDMPVEMKCKMPIPAPPPDRLAQLSKDATLAEGMKTCLAQDLVDRGYIGELEAALKACQ